METYRLSHERAVGYIVEDKAVIHGDRTFLYFKDEEHSYKELNDASNRVANALKSMGVKKGDKVVTILPNFPEYFYAWWGILKLGAWEVPINGSYRGASLADVINRSDAKLAFVGQGLFFDRFQSVQHDLLNIEQVIVAHRLTEKAPTDLKVRWPSHNLADLMTCPPVSPGVEVYNRDPIMIAYTSGTTGPPKGAVLTHEFFIHCCENKIRHMGTTSEDIMYNCFPMYNPTGQFEATFTAFLAGAQVAMAESFNPANFWNDIRKHRCTEFVSMGGAFALVEKQPPRPDDRDHTLKKIYIIPLPVDFQKRCEERFGVRMMEIYGQTECNVTNFRTWDEAKLGSCGPANCGYEVKIFDENDDECPPNVEGEIVVRPSRSHIILREYYKMPDKFASRMRNCWWHTGDLGRIDEDGYLYFVRRVEESIRFRGYSVPTTELENVVATHPKVLECAAYGVPDEMGQEEDVAIAVRLRPGERVSPEELLKHCERDLPFYMIPCYVRFVDEFERTPTMRIIKNGLAKNGVTADTWSRRKAGYQLRRD